MREEPIISGAVLKAALVLIVAGTLGVGAYAIAGGGIDVDLPDLPEIDTVGTEDEVTALEDTTLEDATITGEAPSPAEPTAAATGPGVPFTSAVLASALGQVREEAGADAELTRLTINEAQAQFFVRRGDGVEAYSVRADGGDLERAEATVTISGDATIGDFAFALAAVQPGSVDRMVAAARRRSGAPELEPTVLTLERRVPFGSRELGWTLNAQAGGRYLLYRARPDGSGLRSEGGRGTPIPPAAQEAQRLNECIQAARGNPDEIFACLERF